MRRLLRPLCAPALVLGLCVSSALAAKDAPGRSAAAAGTSVETNSSYTQKWTDPPDIGAMLLRLGLGTVFVLGLCAGTLWFARRWLTGVSVTNAAGRQLQLEETISLGNRASVHLLRVGKCRIVAGVDAGGLKALLALPEPFDGVLDEQLPAAEPEPSSPEIPINIPLSQKAA